MIRIKRFFFFFKGIDYIILIFLVQLTVYRQEKEKRLKIMKLNSFRSCSKYKNPKKTSN